MTPDEHCCNTRDYKFVEEREYIDKREWRVLYDVYECRNCGNQAVREFSITAPQDEMNED